MMFATRKEQFMKATLTGSYVRLVGLLAFTVMLATFLGGWRWP
jgi:hypothetical protein